MPSVTVIGMIYRSLNYLVFMSAQLKHVNHLCVANDATPEVLNALHCLDTPYLDYRDPKPNDYYLNRVYRAWNAGARASKTDLIVFWNSDMYGSKGWLENLLEHYDEKTIPCSRLVESGKMPSGQWGISKDFGQTPGTFRQDDFESYAAEIATDEVLDGGLYMPSVFNREEFLDYGGFPEGNICENGIGAYPSRVIKSGDDYFFHDVMKHRRQVTVANSVVFHMQEGEISE